MHPVEKYSMRSLRSVSARIGSSNTCDVCGYSIYCKCKAYNSSALCKGLNKYSYVCKFLWELLTYRHVSEEQYLHRLDHTTNLFFSILVI